MLTRERVHAFTRFPMAWAIGLAVGFGVESVSNDIIVASVAGIVAGIATLGLNIATAPAREEERFFTSGGQPIIR